MTKRKSPGQSKPGQPNSGQSKDTRETNVTRRHTGSLEHSRLDTTPTQDADTTTQYAGVGKDGYRDTAGTSPRMSSQSGGQRGQGRDVDDDGSQRRERQHFESGSDIRDQRIAPGRDQDDPGQKQR